MDEPAQSMLRRKQADSQSFSKDKGMQQQGCAACTHHPIPRAATND
jgi:hypothetical protein